MEKSLNRKFIFLDIDGVLNAHERHRNGYCGIDRASMNLLNRLVKGSGASLVITSSWRYLFKQMSLQAFHSMMFTHGLDYDVRIFGWTAYDEEIPDRGDQISDYLERCSCSSYVILDDGSTDPPHLPATKPLTQSLLEKHCGKIVFTNGSIGLTFQDVRKALRILNDS